MACYISSSPSSDAVIETHLNKFQQRTGCLVEFASVFGSSQRGYGIDTSDHDVGFVFDYHRPTTLTLKSNIRFKVGGVEFIGMTREFFLEKLGSNNIHHWIILLSDAPYMAHKTEQYKSFRDAVLASTSMRSHLGWRFIQSAIGQMKSTEHNLGKAFGQSEHKHALENNFLMFENDEEFCAAIKHHLQAIYTAALGLAMASGQLLLSRDILVLLGMTELGRRLVPDAVRLIELRRNSEARLQFDSEKRWAFGEWTEDASAYAKTLPIFMYEGSNSPYASQYDPEASNEFNILQGDDNPIRRLIVEHFLTPG